MRILLYNPDNGVTRNFMPHLWMFLLQSLTPPGHEVILIDVVQRRPVREADACVGQRGDDQLHPTGRVLRLVVVPALLARREQDLADEIESNLQFHIDDNLRRLMDDAIRSLP